MKIQQAETARDYYGTHQEQLGHEAMLVLKVLRDPDTLHYYRTDSNVPFDGLTLSEIRAALRVIHRDKPESSISGRCNDLEKLDLARVGINKRHCTITGNLKQVWTATTEAEREQARQRSLFG